MNDTQSRKFNITINNPKEKGFTHEKIKLEASKIKSCIYGCMADEVGGKENTDHTHIYIACSSPVRFSTIKKRFPPAHIEVAHGTSQENRDYIFKLGKWEHDEKGDTNIPETREEWGEMPNERQGLSNEYAVLYDMIESGMSNYEIIEKNPEYMTLLTTIERVRQNMREETFKNEFREMEVTYIWGKTGAGKTKGIMERYGYSNVFRVTSYTHGGFDAYKGQDVLVLEEFNSSLKIQDMLYYLDGYPVELPCRYVNKVSCFTKVFIISNIDLRNQYPKENRLSETWLAFLRRIHKVVQYTDIGLYQEYSTTDYFALQEKIHILEGWTEIKDTIGLPFAENR